MAETPNIDQDFVRQETSGSESQQNRYVITSPWFRFLDAMNITKFGAVLDIVNGGTGQSSGTGSGLPVFQTTPQIIFPVLTSPTILGEIGYQNIVPNVLPNVNNADSRATSVTAVATTIVNQDQAMVFIVHDQTSGGMTVGVMDATGGVVTPAAFAGIAGIAFTRLAGTGLQAAVTAGANPRLLSVYSIAVGTA